VNSLVAARPLAGLGDGDDEQTVVGVPFQLSNCTCDAHSFRISRQSNDRRGELGMQSIMQNKGLLSVASTRLTAYSGLGETHHVGELSIGPVQ
jgi:hypothetical protein